MHERTVAIVMTGGPAEGKFAGLGLKYKALFPVGGRPLVDYILVALQASAVERVFVLQPDDAGLERVVTPHDKNVFLSYDGRARSMGLTLGRGIERLLDYCGEGTLHQRNVMWLPCDIPLVRSEDVDSLVAQSHQPGIDGLITIIAHRLLASAYPDRRFWSLYLSDRGERFSLQSVMFVDGSHYNYATSPEYAGVRVRVTDAFGEPIPGLIAQVDGMRDGRHSVAGRSSFLYDMAARFVRRGLVARVPQALYEIATRRLTSSRISDYVFQALRVRIGAIVSPCTAYSADIDAPDDIERYAKDGGFPAASPRLRSTARSSVAAPKTPGRSRRWPRQS
jgi:molybdopterin-guanine dinucleotide biosynthesis protein A